MKKNFDLNIFIIFVLDGQVYLTIFKITEEKKNIKIHKKKLMKLRPSLKLQKKKEKN